MIGIREKEPTTRILYSMLRVRNLELSLAFYTTTLGMREFRREDYPEGRFTLVFIGYGDESSNSTIELTYNWAENNYQHGTSFGHIAIGVEDLYATCDYLTSVGVELFRKPGPMTYTATNGTRDVIAFIKDPDGYKIELVENHQRRCSKRTET
ncbi:MAG: lactoylglutathione lyase [Alcanivorax sp.]|jgi:lactoylglutathione lyase